MRRGAIVALAGLLVVSCAPNQASRGRTSARGDEKCFVVENDLLRLVLDKASRGNVAEFHDKQSGQNLMAPPSGKHWLYRIRAIGPDGKTVYLDNTQAKESAIGFRRGTLTLTNRTHGDAAIAVVVTCRVRDDSPLTRWRIRIDNHSKLAIREITFPCLVVRPDADYVLYPYCDGSLIEKPGKAFRKGYRLSAHYPGAASAQLMAAGIGQGGLYMAAHDSDGHKKTLRVGNLGDGIDLSLAHYPEDAPGNDYRQAYDVVAGPWQGASWHHAADIYKAWAEHQPWCARKLVDRSDVPAWLRRAPMFITICLTTRDRTKKPASQYNSVRPTVKGYADALGRPMCALIGDWHGRGYYIAPHYFPPCGGTDRFKALTRGLLDDGNHSIVFLCSLHWTVDKRPPLTYKPYDDWECFRREGEPHAIVGEDGKTFFRGVPDKFIGQNAVLCPGTAYTQRVMREFCRQCYGHGITIAQIEAVGGGVPTCYSKTHKHPPGGGSHQARDMRRLFRTILRDAQRQGGEFGLTIEEPGEFFIQALTGYHCRDYMQGYWPRTAPGARGVPLFTYLYHEYCLGYGGHGASVTDAKHPSRRSEYMHAMGFVCGTTPAISMWGTHMDPKDVHPSQMRLMKSIAAVLGSPACDYLMLGRMLHPITLDVPATEPIGFWRGHKRKPTNLAFPAVLHSVWEHPRFPGTPGRGYALVNIADKEVELALPLTPPQPGRPYVVRAHGLPAVPGDVGGERTGPSQLALKLKPGEALFVELLAR